MSDLHAHSDRDRNAAHMLWDTAKDAGDRTAIIDRERSIRYAELRDRAGSISAALEETGVVPGDPVAILLERGVEGAASYFGVLAAGGLSVAMNATLRARQIEYILSHSGASVLLTSADIMRKLHRPLDTDITVLDVAETECASPTAPVERGGDADAQITYTSGSTGMQKGVLATHANIWAAIQTVAGYLSIEPTDRIASLIPFSSVYGANQLQCAVLTGATLVIERSPIANEIVARMREMDVTVLAGVPPLWMQLLQAPMFHERPVESLRILQSAGGHLAPAAVRKLRATQPQARIFLQYGMTEVFRSAFLPPEETDRRPDSMGRAMPGTTILVVRDDLTLCHPGEVGELVHCGPTTARGYWNDPEKTAQVFRPHPLNPDAGPVVFSGDMVRRDKDGFLYFVGRRDRMIKTLGYRVGPDEILDVVYASGEIVEGLVTTEPDSRRGERIVVHAVLAPGGSGERLQRFCRAELPRYMQPSRIELQESLPRTLTGKLDVRAIADSAFPT